MSRYKKAQAAFVFMIVIWVSLFLILFALKTIHLNKALSFKGELDIFIERNDYGTEMYTILAGEKSDIKNMVLLGSHAAKNMPTKFQDAIKSIMQRLGKDASTPIESIIKDAASEITTYEPGESGYIEAVESDIKLNWPVKNYNTIVSGYGWRILSGTNEFHGGLDFAVAEVDVYSAYPTGKVVRVGTGCQPSSDVCKNVVSCSANRDPYCCCNGGLGNFITLEHEINGETFYTHYDHLKEVYVKEDDEIGNSGMKPDQPIGKSGNTGYVKGETGYHLHFELSESSLKKDSASINPCPRLPQPAPQMCQQASTRYEQKPVYSGLGEPVIITAEIPMPNGGRGRIEMVE